MRLFTKAFIIIGLTGLLLLSVTVSYFMRASFAAYLVLSFLYGFALGALLLRTAIFKQKKQVDKPIPSNNNKITQLAHYDAATGLPNLVFFNDVLNKAINYANRHKKILAVLIINIDSVKNNQDLFLNEMRSRFSRVLRGEDVLAKLDGEEFVILLNDINKPKFASAVAEKILTVCSEPLTIDSKQIPIKASIGICIYPNDANSIEELFNNAYVALHAAKQESGDKYRFYSKGTDAEAHEYMELANELRVALKDNEFALYYQPKLLLKSGTITGVETFLRWSHPTRGLLHPNKFLSIAEESGIIISIGQWILYEACRINKSWQKEGYEHITIGVNLSAKQFYHPDIAEMISQALHDTGLDPYYLEIEVPEEIVMSNIEMSSEILHKIKNTGVKISIDHFGTGYISVKHLKNIPVSAVKIDQNFIKGVPNIPNDTAITNAFIALSHNLGLEVVADGVETIEQAQYLGLQNCDIVQGYFLSYPVPADKITLQFKKLMDTVL